MAVGYSPDTDMLTRDGWKSITAVSTADHVASLNADGRLEYLQPTATRVYSYNGRMYSLATTQVDLLVTESHPLYAKTRSIKMNHSYDLIEGQHVFGRRFRLRNNASWNRGRTPEYFTFPGYEVRAGQGGVATKQIPPLKLPMATYLLLLGAFISEGNIINNPRSGSYGIDICQGSSKDSWRLLAALNAAGLRYRECGNHEKVRMYSKHLMLYFRQFGRAHQKFIPRQVFSWSAPSLRTLYEWLMWGDGSQTQTGHSYTTTSPQLANDMQQLCLHIGLAARLKRLPGSPREAFGKIVQARDAWVVYIYRSKHYPTINHSHVNQQNAQSEVWRPYAGKLHCVTLPRNHVLYVRRNGKPVWCGDGHCSSGNRPLSAIRSRNLLHYDHGEYSF